MPEPSFTNKTGIVLIKYILWIYFLQNFKKKVDNWR